MQGLFAPCEVYLSSSLTPYLLEEVVDLLPAQATTHRIAKPTYFRWVNRKGVQLFPSASCLFWFEAHSQDYPRAKSVITIIITSITKPVVGKRVSRNALHSPVSYADSVRTVHSISANLMLYISTWDCSKGTHACRMCLSFKLAGNSTIFIMFSQVYGKVNHTRWFSDFTIWFSITSSYVFFSFLYYYYSSFFLIEGNDGATSNCKGMKKSTFFAQVLVFYSGGSIWALHPNVMLNKVHREVHHCQNVSIISILKLCLKLFLFFFSQVPCCIAVPN